MANSIPAVPTAALPPLMRLAIHSTGRIKDACQSLRELYFPQAPPSAILDPKITIPQRSIQHPIHDRSVPDSGYASAEEDNEDEDTTGLVGSSSDGDTDDENELEALQADPLERAFAIKWLTGFITRSDIWISSSVSEEDAGVRAGILEEAASLLSAFTGNEGEEDVALTRTFSFPINSDCQYPNRATRKAVNVELNDAPLSKDDHTSVGLQSWGSSILLADRLCLEPDTFSLTSGSRRILELGAGTGMLSIVASKVLHPSSVEIVATDYHPDVLNNLSNNVATNFPASRFSRAPITVTALDWEHPSYIAPLDKPFDLIFAADVIYHPSHAAWIKRCVERLLLRPGPEAANGGVFWLIIPVRTTGRHEGMSDTVDALFPLCDSVVGSDCRPALAIFHREEVGRQGGVGRADEGAYKLFKIGWVN